MMWTRRLSGFGVAAPASLLAFCGHAAIAADTGPPPSVDTLAPIEVTAQKMAPPEIHGRRDYDLAHDLQAITGTAADVLNEIPSVDVDADGVVSLRGDTHVTILIDGKPAAQIAGAAAADGLFQLPANEIVRIEVMTNPPAQYKAEGAAGVINIITRKARATTPSSQLLANVGNDERYNLGASGNAQAGRFSLSGVLGLRQDDRQRDVRDRRTALDPATGQPVQSAESVAEHIRRLTPSGKATLDVALDPDDSLTLGFSHRERQGRRHFDQFDSSGLPGAAPDALSLRASAGREWRLDGGQTLEFDHRFAAPGETLRVTLQRAVFREREHYDYLDTDILPPAAPTRDTLDLALDLVTTEAGIDYTLPLAAGRDLKLGYDFEDDSNSFANGGATIDPLTGLPVTNPVLTNAFHYLQRVHAAYGSVTAVQGEWSMQAGLRLERTLATYPQVTGDAAIDHRYAGLYPSLHVERSLSDQVTASLALSRRLTRPDPEALDPFVDHQDTQNLRAGNANLRPQDTRAIELGIERNTKPLDLALTGYLRQNHDSVTDVTQVVSAEVVLVTKANLPSDRSEGLEFSLKGRPSKRWSYGLSGNLFDSQIDAVALGAPGLQSTRGVNGKANLDFRPTPADTWQVSASRSDRRLTPQGTIGSLNLVNFGLKHQFRDNLYAVLTVSDLFGGQVLRRSVDTAVLTDRYQRTQIGRIAYLGVVYHAGGLKARKPEAFDYDQ